MGFCMALKRNSVGFPGGFEGDSEKIWQSGSSSSSYSSLYICITFAEKSDVFHNGPMLPVQKLGPAKTYILRGTPRTYATKTGAVTDK